MKHPMLARTLLVAAVAVAVLFPITMIEGKISERRARANDVVAQFAQETSGPQVVFGPFLAMTCEETVIVERQVKHAGKEETEREPKTQPCSTVFFAPRTFKADATVPVETLHRGLYSIRLFRAGLEMSGELEWPAPPSIAGAVSRDWKQARGLFRQALKLVPDDGPSKMYVGRCDTYLKSPPSRGWDGVYTLKSK